MSQRLITGIFPSSDVAALENAMRNVPGFDRGHLTVFTKEARSAEHDESQLNFSHAAEGGMMTSSGGTGVPGVGGGTSSLSSFVHHGGASKNYLGDLPVPSDIASNYNYAIEEGRVVVAYTCDDGDISPIERAFRAAGLRNVKSFAPKTEAKLG